MRVCKLLVGDMPFIYVVLCLEDELRVHRLNSGVCNDLDIQHIKALDVQKRANAEA